MCTRFNQQVEMDLLFHGERIILHVIDVHSRYSGSWIIRDKKPRTIIEAFTRGWMRIFGPPEEIISDEEGGIAGQAWGKWCDRHSCKRTLVSQSEHANLIE